MNRNRWAPLLLLLAPFGLAAWVLLPGSAPRMSPKRLPAAIPAPVAPASRPADSDDAHLIARGAQAAPGQRRA